MNNPRKWTVMLYMAGDNNLSEECVYSLTELKKGLSNIPELTVVAQFDPNGVRVPTRRYVLTADKSLDEDATNWTALETNTGEPQNLLDFVRWATTTYFADHFMVVLVGHGSGTDDDFLLRDENPPDALSILELQYVFETINNDLLVVDPKGEHKIDILGMDTCLMNMAEICYQLNRTNITYLVGSEGFSPNTGWPYEVIIQKLVDQLRSGAATPEWLATLIPTELKNFYVPYISGGISVDQSALEIAKIEDVKTALTELVKALRDEIRDGKLDRCTPKQNALLLAHWDTQSYNGEVFVDLTDLCNCLIDRYRDVGDIDGPVPTWCGNVKDAVATVVVKSCTAGAAFQYSFGLSIYFPWAFLSPKYSNLALPNVTNWLNFLEDYHTKTRRPPRSCAEIRDTGRASVPINKGRDGRIESMRNPPTRICIQCTDRMTHTAVPNRQILNRGSVLPTKEGKKGRNNRTKK